MANEELNLEDIFLNGARRNGWEVIVFPVGERKCIKGTIQGFDENVVIINSINDDNQYNKPEYQYVFYKTGIAYIKTFRKILNNKGE